VAWEDLTFDVIHTPGHTQGSVVFLLGERLFGGDTLFRRGVGRTDLPGGDSKALVASIQEKLYVLPEETIVYPGHGPVTTIGEERRENPFVALKGL
jgi:hydroxyacylglutathione hydrolase